MPSLDFAVLNHYLTLLKTLLGGETPSKSHKAATRCLHVCVWGGGGQCIAYKGPFTLLMVSQGIMCRSSDLESSTVLKSGKRICHPAPHHIDGINGSTELRQQQTCVCVCMGSLHHCIVACTHLEKVQVTEL